MLSYNGPEGMKPLTELGIGLVNGARLAVYEVNPAVVGKSYPQVKNAIFFVNGNLTNILSTQASVSRMV